MKYDVKKEENYIVNCSPIIRVLQDRNVCIQSLIIYLIDMR